ncbi:DUF3021 family protein [Mobilitalea sibirica]|uniref:DUF3021 family protein n=1 Tax=Mobilitalea sibirica TaxID=1462919 RepID=A0A8J7H3T5_9FIRM|nr:DUF3021 family protein [Mobilitalea sibirica]MBH1941730.1 DUF3021 family protein [Mobilitalea sibirica]
MNKIRKIHLPAISMAFTLAILFSATITLLRGNDTTGIFASVMQMLGFVVALQIINVFISRIRFRKYYQYYLSNFFIMYAFFISVAYVFHWFGFRLENIILNTIIFIFIFTFIQHHFYKLLKKEADEINALLDNKERQ